MSLFRFRLEAQDGSGHFRQGTTEAASREEAKQQLLAKEDRFVAFQLDADRQAELLADHGAKSIDDLPKAAPITATEAEKDAFRALPQRDRRHLNLHRQSKPYKLVSLQEIR